MKILRIVSSGFGEGGAEIGVMHIQPILEAEGHEVRVLASDSHTERPHFNDYFFRAPVGFFGRLMYTWNPYAHRQLKWALKEYNPDVVHLHTLGTASPAVLFALSGYPTVATVHGPEGYTRDLIMWNLPKSDFKNDTYKLRGLTFIGTLRYFYYRYVNYPLYRMGFKHVDRVVTISTYIKKLMDAQNMQSSYIPNGIQMFDYDPLTLDKVTHTVIFAGRLEKFKGLEYLLKALPRVIKVFPDTKLIIAGSGRDADELKELTKVLQIENHVSFLGHLTDRDELYSHYTQASVAVVPSIWPEVCSRAGIEALSVGRAVIGSDVGGTPDWLINNETGLLVPPGKSEAIADALIVLFSDPSLIIKMGKHARKKAEEYDIRLHAKRILEVYREVIVEKQKVK